MPDRSYLVTLEVEVFVREEDFNDDYLLQEIDSWEAYNLTHGTGYVTYAKIDSWVEA